MDQQQCCQSFLHWKRIPRVFVLSILMWVWGTPLFFPQAGPSLERRAEMGGAWAQAAQAPSVAEVAQKAMPAVVNISTTQKIERRRAPFPFPMPDPGPFGEKDPFEEFFRRFFGDRPPFGGPLRSLGSGFIISEDGYIITNHHVIREADKITVRLSMLREEEYQATIVGTDEKTDLALIKIEAKHSLPTLPLGNSTNLRVGDWVIAIGNPFGLEQTVTIGIVSAKGRVIGGPYDDFIQTDASINPGNSGGPLLNLAGEVVGVNTAIFSRGGGNIGIGFAIPIDLAKTVVAQLRETGAVTRAWLGVMIQAVTPELARSFGLQETRGALVAEVTPGSPAAQVGMQRGDIIVEFNGTAIRDSHELPALVAQSPVGSRAKVTVLRDGKERTFSVTLGELKDQEARAQSGESQWGMTVADLSPELARRFQLEQDRKGVVVVDIEPGSPADTGGLRPGDIIEEVNRQPVSTVKDFTTAVASAKGRETLLLLVRRGNTTSFFALRQEQ